jgi:hypothetical protein
MKLIPLAGPKATAKAGARQKCRTLSRKRVHLLPIYGFYVHQKLITDPT